MESKTIVSVSPLASLLGIARSNRMFVQIAAIGECDENGKTIFEMRGSTKIVAEPDKPITTCILPLLMSLLQRSHVEEPELMESELKALKDYVAGLAVIHPA